MRIMKQARQAAAWMVVIHTSVMCAYACPTKGMVPRRHS